MKKSFRELFLFEGKIQERTKWNVFQIVLIFEETAVSLVIHNITHQSQYGSGIAICIFFRENENPHKLEKFDEFSMVGILLANVMNFYYFSFSHITRQF